MLCVELIVENNLRFYRYFLMDTMSSEDRKEIIQYVPFMSFVHASFWHTLTEVKLDVDKLSETNKEVFGRYTYRDDIGPVFEVDGTSFNSTPQKEQFYQNVTGNIMNKNTIEEFKNIDKAGLLNSVGQQFWANIKKKMWISDPSSLLNFTILSFADLKKFHYYYWFAFPAPTHPIVHLKNKSNLTEHFNNQQTEALTAGYRSLDSEQRTFFIVTKKDKLSVLPLSKVLHKDNNSLSDDLKDLYFCFADSSNTGNPGWPLRLFLAALLDHYPGFAGKVVQVLAVRCNSVGGIENSQVYTIHIPQDVQPAESAGWVGWERNDKGNFGPKLANMSASMDPVKLIETSSDLNIKLMKWRLVPELDVDVMKTTKCLLLGAGTLGCHVARDLLAWGFRHITFIDNGKVSYSNPTRQVLFTFRDCASGRRKAEAAADNLRDILPTVITKGLPIHIPMPGHPVGDSLKEEAVSNVKILTDAIVDHDVIFLLLDTREARWLPTLIAAHYGKIVINAALGFDSYLVMRHGIAGGSNPLEVSAVHSAHIPGAQLGCYFCNDVTAPRDSTRDRTLDQQCTVTRPGVAAVAGALAVELLVAMLQHPSRIDAPAPYNINEQTEKENPQTQGVLGPVPHSIRGFLHSYQSILPTCPKFKQCIACSETVIDKYRSEGIEFLLKVFNSGSYLEDVTGLSELHLTAEMTDVLTLSDDEDEE